MSDLSWQMWKPSRDGEAPQGVSVKTHEIRFVNSDSKLEYCKYDPLWFTDRTYEYCLRDEAPVVSGSDNLPWQMWKPLKDGHAPKNVTLRNCEIWYKDDMTKRFEPCTVEPFWLADVKYRYRPRSAPAVSDSNDYTALRTVLNTAYDQAARGKGVERHGNGKAWTEQPIFTIAGQVGDGFNAGQAIKKIQEAQQMAARGEYAKAQHEVLGAIVYAASLHVLWNKESNRDSQ